MPPEHRTTDEDGDYRRVRSAKEVSGIHLNAQLVLLLINLGALVWGAAKISAAVEQLTDTTKALSATTVGLRSDIDNMKIDVEVLKTQVEINREKSGARTAAP
jgi:cell division protein FtsB